MSNVISNLPKLEQFESMMADLYDRMSNQFASDKEAELLFARLASEERSHRSQVEYLSRVARKNAQLLSGVNIDVEAIDRETLAVKRILEQLPKLSLAEVIPLVLFVESGAAEVTWKDSLKTADRGLAGMIRGLEEGSRRHRDTLAAFASSREFAVRSRT